MFTRISNIHPADVHQVEQAHAPRVSEREAQTPPVQKSGALSHDQVTLKNAGQPDRDTDSK